MIKTCEPVGEFVNDQVNGVTFLYVDETDDEAAVWGTKLAYNFALLAAHLIGISSVYPTAAYKTPGLLFGLRQTPGSEKAPAGGGVIREGMGVGSPDTVIRNLKMWEEIGVDRMVFILNAAEVSPGEGPELDAPLRRAGDAGVREGGHQGNDRYRRRARVRASDAVMPDPGQLTEDRVAHTGPVLAPLYPPPPWSLPGARVLKVMFETDKEAVLAAAAEQAHAVVAAVRHDYRRALPGEPGRALHRRAPVHRLPRQLLHARLRAPVGGQQPARSVRPPRDVGLPV